ncbi:MAG: zinc-ribbon domain containing protein [Planctomycetes bacterium]|nr:zinc-ribbon domain containing protein [Planctomycetota bacterium]
MAAYQDKHLTCGECGVAFVFTAVEQEFHQQKGFANEPRRCVPCREKRKREGRGLLPGQQMYKTLCAGCGAEAEVPFVPRLQKPVYCRPCFDKNKGGGHPRPGP